MQIHIDLYVRNAMIYSNLNKIIFSIEEHVKAINENVTE